MAKIDLISQCFVKPTNIANEAPKEPIQLGLKDLYMLTMQPMQKGLLFDTKPHNLRSDFIIKLEKALRISLEHFYTLAGEFETQKYYDEHACSFYLDSEKGLGARLIHAAVDFTVSDILSSVDVHPIVDCFFDLGEKSVNYDGHTRPLLSIQVTELRDGVFIGFTMNHCVADGTSLWHFISTLSEIFGQLNDNSKTEGKSFNNVYISKTPIFNHGNGSICKFPYLEPDEFIYRYDPGPLRVRLFHFSSESISILKSKANEENELENKISSFQALIGFIWRSITLARDLQPELEVNCIVLLNARARLDPPISDEYFGGSLVPAIGVSKVGDLLSNGSGLGSSHGALLMHQAIKMDVPEFIRTVLKRIEENPRIDKPGPQSVYYKPYGVTIGGSSKFNMYGPEFGLGKAQAVLAGYASKDDGKVTANPGRDGDGSVDLEICLKPETMNALELDQEFMSYVS